MSNPFPNTTARNVEQRQTNYFNDLCKDILKDHFIRSVVITDRRGFIIAEAYRRDLTSFTHEETEKYAVHAAMRAVTHKIFESKFGHLEYSLDAYEKENRVTIPMLGRHGIFYLLLSLDTESNVPSVIEKIWHHVREQ